MLLLLRVNFYTLQKIELLFEILETRLENQLDEVARSPQSYRLFSVKFQVTDFVSFCFLCVYLCVCVV